METNINSIPTDLFAPPPPPPPLPPWAGDPAVSAVKDKAPEIDASNYDGSCRICSAVADGDIVLVKELVEQGESANSDSLRGTPLSIAVRTGQYKLVEYLIKEAACDVNKRDYDDETALSLSLHKKFSNISLLLISSNAKLNYIDKVTGLTPLATAVNNQQLQVAEAMLDRGCEVNLKDRFNQTPLLHACLLSEPNDRNEVKYQLINLLMRYGADVNVRVGPPFNGYLIHKLILEQQTDSLAHLISLLRDNQIKLDLNLHSLIDKNTALHLAIAVCSEQLVKLLLENGAFTQVVNVFGDTPLSKAIKCNMYNQEGNIKLLLSYGADPNFESQQRNARYKGPCKPLFAAIEQGKKEVVDMLLQNGAKLDELDYLGYCPIMPCLVDGVSVSNLRYIVNLMDQQCIKYDISGWEYLKKAFSWQGHLQFLIDRGLDIQARSPEGHQILHTNGIKLHPASLEVLLQNGLDPDSLSGQGQTMLCMSAGLSGYWQAIELLVQYGADINKECRDPDHDEMLTPLQRAFLSEYEDEPAAGNSCSQFKFFLNCGATLTRNLSYWRDSIVADRAVYELSEDESDSEGTPLQLTACPDTKSDWRDILLQELASAFTPLPLSMTCRKVIRNILIQNHGTANVKSVIYQLPVTRERKEFLAFVGVPTSHVLR